MLALSGSAASASADEAVLAPLRSVAADVLPYLDSIGRANIDYMSIRSDLVARFGAEHDAGLVLEVFNEYISTNHDSSVGSPLSALV